MPAVRIHLAKMSPLLSRMITDLLAPEADIEIVSSGDGSEESLVSARAEGANMIITQEAAADEPCLRAIVEDPPLTILAIASTGSSSTSINFLRQEIRLRGERRNSLAEAVRKAAELA